MLRTLTTALIIWLVAFAYNLATHTSGGDLAFNPWGYQIGLVLLMITTVGVATRVRQFGVALPRFTQIVILLTTAIVMDITVLLSFYPRSVADWLVMVLPVYLVIIPLNTQPKPTRLTPKKPSA